MKFILDTNIWFTQLINKSEQQLLTKFFEESKILIISDALLSEIKETGSHPKFRQYFSNQRLEELMQGLMAAGFMLRNIPKVAQFQDNKDEFLLDLCHVSNADYLVTGDKALLNLAQYHKTEIITLARLKEILS